MSSSDKQPLQATAQQQTAAVMIVYNMCEAVLLLIEFTTKLPNLFNTKI